MRDRSLEVRLLFVSLALAAVLAVPSAALTKGQARCVDGLGLAFEKVERAVARQTADCLKRHAKGVPLVPKDPSITSVSQCTHADRTGAVARAELTADKRYSKLCMPPPEGKLTDPYPPFGATDAARAMVEGHAVARSLAVDVFGVLMDEALVTDPAGAKCQQAAWSALLRCEQASTRAFLLCQKAGLRAEELDERDELRELCLGAGGAAQPDPRGRVAAACTAPGKGIAKALAGPCAGADLAALFPGCTAESDTQACLARKAACRACRATSSVGDLRRSCDLFDDGERNQSCADETALSCEGPAEAAMVTAVPPNTIEVAGQVSGAEITEVLVDGVPVPVDAEGWFAAQVAPDFGVHFHEVAVPGGAERVCTFLAAETWGGETALVPDALSFYLGQPALDDTARTGDPNSLGDLLQLVLASPALPGAMHAQLLAANPLKPSSCDQEVCLPVVGCTCVLSSRVRYTSSSISASRAVELDFVAGGIALEASASNLTLGLRADGTAAGIAFDVTGTIAFPWAAASLISDVAIESGALGAAVRPGSVAAAVGTPVVDVDGVPPIVDDVISTIAAGEISGRVEDTIRNFLGNELNDALSETFAGFSFPTSTLNVPGFGGGTVALSLDAEPSSVTTNAARSLLGLAATVSAPATHALPSLGVPLQPGLPFTDPVGTPLAFAGHIGFLNQTLHALWRGGILSGAVGDFPEPNIALVFEGMLPPVVTAGDGDALAVQLGALHVHFESAGPPIGGPSPVASLGADATATLAVGDDGALTVESLTLDEVYVTGLDVPIPPEFRAEAEAQAAEILALVLEPALEGAVRALPIPSFLLPSELEDVGVPAGSRFGIVNPEVDATPTHVEVGGDAGLL